MRKNTRTAAAFVIALSSAGGPALAHHAVNAQFDVDKEGTFTGTLARLDNVQPHSFWYFVVKKPDGTVQKWSLEGPSPGNLRRSGLKMKEDIQPGKQFTIFYNPPRDHSNTGYVRGVVVDGKRVNLQADYSAPGTPPGQ